MADGSVKFDTAIDSTGMRTGLAGLGRMLLTSQIIRWLVDLGKTALNTGIEFESAFAGVKKTVEATDEEFAELRQEIIDMSTELPLAASEIAGISEAAGQLGIKTDAILDFTRVMADLGVATNMTAETAATQLARLANITQMPQDQFDRLGSTIVALGNNFATTEAEITAMALRLAGAGSQVGMTEAQILSLAGAASSVGLAAELGGSAFSRVLTMMQLAVEEGGDQLTAFADVSGMSAAEFYRAFKNDAAGALVSFIEGLGDAEESGRSAIGVIAELGDVEGLSTLNTIAVRDALLRAAGASNVFSDALELGTEAWDENNALTREAEQRYQTLESRIQIFKNTASSLGIALYDGIREPLGEIVAYATDAMQQLEDAYQEGGFSGLVEELGNVLGDALTEIVEAAPAFVEAVLGLIENLVTTLIDNSDTIINAFIEIGLLLVDSVATLAPQLITAAFTIVTQLALGLAEALPTLIETIITCFTACIEALIENIPLLLEAALQIIEGLIAYLPELLPMLLEAALSMFVAIVEFLPELILLIIEALPALIESFITAVLEFIPQLLEAVMTIVNAIIEATPQIITTICSMLPSIITSIVESLVNMIPQIARCGVELITSLVQSLPEIIDGIIECVPLILDSLITAFIESFPLMVECGMEMMLALVEALPQIIVSLLSSVVVIVNSIIECLVECIPLIIEAGIVLLTSLIGELPFIITTLIAAIPTIVLSLVDAIVENLPLIINSGIELFEALILELPTIITSLIEAVPQIVTALVEAFGDMVSDFSGVGEDLLNGIGDGIANAVSSVVERAKEAANNILGSVKSFFGIRSPSRLFRDVIGKNLMLGMAEGIEDETSSALASMGKAAKEISNVEFEANGITFEDPDALYANVSGTVNEQNAKTAQSKAAEANGYHNDADDDINDSRNDAPQYVENNIYVDGRKTARILTPYIAKEIEWEGT